MQLAGDMLLLVNVMFYNANCMHTRKHIQAHVKTVQIACTAMASCPSVCIVYLCI